MKKTLLILVLCHALSHAQEVKNEPQYVKICFEKIKLEQEGEIMTNFTKPGELTLYDSNAIGVDGPMDIGLANHGKSKKITTDWIITASKVEVISPGNTGLLRADKLSLDNATKKGTLTGHVTLIENGTARNLGKTAEVEFKENSYRIVSEEQ